MLCNKKNKSPLTCILAMIIMGSLFVSTTAATDSTKTIPDTSKVAFPQDSAKFPLDPSKFRVTEDTTTAQKVKGTFVIETFHRIYSTFHQVDTVKFGEPFDLGEGEYTAEIIRFNPDLAISMSGKFMQMSDTLNNPAVRIRVTSKEKIAQESWAFYLGGAPHFHRDSYFGFVLGDFKVEKRFINPPEKKPNRK